MLAAALQVRTRTPSGTTFSTTLRTSSRVLARVREKCPYLLPSVPISTPPQQHNQYAPPAPASAQARPPTPPQPPDSLRTGFWTTTGGADWTDLELMPPDCALTGGYAPVSGDPPQTAPGLCASDQELPMANKSRQGRFRCLKIQIQVFVTVFWGCLAVP